MFLYRVLYAQTADAITNEKCRIASIPTAVQIDPLTFNLFDTICENTSTFFAGEELRVAGIYEDSLVSSIGCDSVVYLNLFITPDSDVSATLDIIPPQCEDTADAVITITDIDNAALPTRVTVNNMLIDDPYRLDGLPSGDYRIEVVDRFGCAYDSLVSLDPPESFQVFTPAIISAELGQRVDIRPILSVDEIAVLWQTDCTITCDTCIDLSFGPLDDCVLTGVFRNGNGCEIVTETRIDLTADRTIFFPDAFTPNGDAMNDVFSISGNPSTIEEIVGLEVYDRWGNKMYSGKPALNVTQDGWSGLDPAGRLSPAGVYVYVCTVRYIDGVELVFQGSTTLLY